MDNSKLSLNVISFSVPLLETRHIISQVFPLHSTDDLTELREEWMQKFFSRQPLSMYQKDLFAHCSFYYNSNILGYLE
jgi:hypothetical protein